MHQTPTPPPLPPAPPSSGGEFFDAVMRQSHSGSTYGTLTGISADPQEIGEAFAAYRLHAGQAMDKVVHDTRNFERGLAGYVEGLHRTYEDGSALNQIEAAMDSPPAP